MQLYIIASKSVEGPLSVKVSPRTARNSPAFSSSNLKTFLPTTRSGMPNFYLGDLAMLMILQKTLEEVGFTQKMSPLLFSVFLNCLSQYACKPVVFGNEYAFWAKAFFFPNLPRIPPRINYFNNMRRVGLQLSVKQFRKSLISSIDNQ